MKNLNSTPDIKELRQRKGLSQEELAEKSGLNLRTVQRIENGETEPRGDSLKRIAAALDITPNELIDWAVREDSQALKNLNLSALAFIVIGVLGVLLPFIVWNGKKGTVKGLDRTAKEVINFQITWNVLLFVLIAIGAFVLNRSIHLVGDVSPTIVASWTKTLLLGVSTLYLYNFIFILVNQMRINKGRKVRYFPKINFLR